MDKIICIDLTKFNYEELEKFCIYHSFDYDSISTIKRNGRKKLWLNDRSHKTVATSIKKKIFISIHEDNICDYIKLELSNGEMVNDCINLYNIDIEDVDDLIKRNIHTVWIYKPTGHLVLEFFLNKYLHENNVANKKFIEFLNSIKPMDHKLPKVDVNRLVNNILNESMTVDSLLDKIGQYGVDSLTDEEKLFLDSSY